MRGYLFRHIRYWRGFFSIIVIAILIGGIITQQNQNAEKLKRNIGRISDNLHLHLDKKIISSANFAIDLNSFQSPKVYISDIKKPNFPFTGLMVEWNEDRPDKTDIKLFIRFLEKEKWTDFKEIHKEDDVKSAYDIQMNKKFFGVNDTTAFQYKIILTSEDSKKTPILSNLIFTYLNSPSESENTSSIMTNKLIAVLKLFTDDKLKIIKRSEWGADETLRIYKGDQNPIDLLYQNDREFRDKFKDELITKLIVEKNEDGNLLTWPIEYPAEIKKVVLHHTATSKDLDDPMQAIRNIYYYHTISRGFGDIGYNFIIDQQGKIYEGRAGGENVVGGHAVKFNHGTVGIAFLGDYTNNEPKYEMIQSLFNLLKYLTEKYNIKPNRSSLMRGMMVPNISGHRDVDETTCPGEKVYDKLPLIRKLLESKENNGGGQKEFDFIELSVRNILKVKPDSNNIIEINLKNTGQKQWNDKTYLLANANASNSGIIKFSADNKNRFNIAPLKENSVVPGGIGNFQISADTSLLSGLINFEITPMFNGETKTSKYVYLPIFVDQPKLSYELAGAKFTNKRIAKGKKFSYWIDLKNTGDISWRKEGDLTIKIGTENPKDHPSVFAENKSNRIGFLEQNTVKPGETGRFMFKLKAPEIASTYTQKFAPVIDGVAWLENKNLLFTITVLGKNYTSELTDIKKDEIYRPRESREVLIKLKNTGDVLWKAEGLSALKGKINKKSSVIASSIKLLSDTAPGEIGTLKINVTAPSKAGKYQIFIMPSFQKHRLLKKPIVYGLTVEKSADSDEIIQNGPNIRIKLTFLGNPIITANSKMRLMSDNKEIINMTPDDSAEVRIEENLYQIKINDKAFILSNFIKFIPDENGIIEVKNMEKRASWKPEINFNKFRGKLEVRIENNKLIVINEIPMEDYLKGTGELDSKDPEEKQKAIIIAARSYAMHYLENEKFPGKPYHGSDDPNIFQKYLGYVMESRSPLQVKLVDETRGKIVTYEGKLVKTPYFSQSDGRTRSAKEVWGKEITYLQSVPDPYCEGLTLYGHGVGLSGCGAEGAAKNGKTYEEILKYYYQGIEIQKIY